MLQRRSLAALASIALSGSHVARAATPVTLRAADGVMVFGDFEAATTAPRRGTLLLFHMAGSNRGEYAPIAPELARLGFDSLAIDQRSGDSGFGRRNETVARLGRDAGFHAALPDLEAALAWARQRDPAGRVLLCGSSYSAALVFVLAAQHAREVTALLAFSPGEYIGGVSIRGAAARVTCPAFVTAASDPAEAAAAATLLAAVRGVPKRQYRPDSGLHGAATLRQDRNPRGAAAAWAAVRGFLDEVAPA